MTINFGLFWEEEGGRGNFIDKIPFVQIKQKRKMIAQWTKESSSLLQL